MKYFILFFLILGMLSKTDAQVFTNKVVGKKNKEHIDSLKEKEYKYVLPIWGKKATEAGYDLPYSAGLGINYLWQESSIDISNLSVGFNNEEPYNLDEIVRFNNATAQSRGVNIRPDFWLFPFLNVYGILAKSQTSTTVDFSIYAPDENGSEEILNYETVAEFDASTVGFGLTPTIGVGGGWMAFDMNFTWTDIPELENPAFAFVFGPRLGKSIQLGKNPERNLNFWVGGFRFNIQSETSGNIALEEVLPETNDINEKINNGQQKVIEKQNSLDAWYNNLAPVEQKLNADRYERRSSALETANSILYNTENGLDNLETSTIQYDLDKKQSELWNFVVGVQFQYNKHWMIRGEYGFLGERKQLLVGLQYRFGL